MVTLPISTSQYYDGHKSYHNLPIPNSPLRSTIILPNLDNTYFAEVDSRPQEISDDKYIVGAQAASQPPFFY